MINGFIESKFSGRTLLFSPVRIIPFDIGAPLEPAVFAEFVRYLKADPLFVATEISGVEQAITGLDGAQFTVGRTQETGLLLDCYRDGFASFTINDAGLEISAQRFRPEEVLGWRREVHEEILTGTHVRSAEIRQALNRIRDFTRQHHIPVRRSGTISWGREGLSYVMTIHSIDPMGSRQFGTRFLRELRSQGSAFHKVMYLLEPSISGLVEKHLSGETYWLPSSDRELGKVVEARLAADPQLGQSIEIREDALAFANWGNVYICSPRDQSVIRDYAYVEKRLQHLWFMCFALNDVFQEVGGSSTRGRYRETRNLWVDSSLAIHRFRRFIDPSLSNRHQKILTELMRTSRVDRQITLLESHVDTMRTVADLQQADRERRVERRIGLLLILLTLVQVLGVVLQFVQALK